MKEQLVRQILYPAFQKLKGRSTMELMAEWRHFHTGEADEIDAYQLRRLDAILHYAYEHVPYYRAAFDQQGVSPDDFQDAGDLDLFPLLSKEAIQRDPDQFIASGYHEALRSVRTGGSTGHPMKYYMGEDAFAASEAATWRARGWWGLRLGQPYVLLWGHSASFGQGLSGRLAKLIRPYKDRLLNRRTLSAYEMSPENMAQYLQVMRDFDPVFMRGYPSSLYTMASYIRDQAGLDKAPHLKAVISTSELLFDWQKDTIGTVFNCPVINEYGANETGVMAYSCPAGQLHIMDEHVFLELVRPDAVGEEAPGEIVVTQLHHRGAPLIRYRIGDMAMGISRGCSCGSNLRVLEGLQGRVHDLIKTPQGQIVHGQLFTHIIEQSEEVKQFQIYQADRKAIQIRIVPFSSQEDIPETWMRKQILEKVNGSLDLQFHYLEEIEQTPAGKYRWIVSDVAADLYRKERS